MKRKIPLGCSKPTHGISAHVTLAKEEIAVGGELLNTHVEAAHNRVAAQDALEAAESAEKTNGAA